MRSIYTVFLCASTTFHSASAFKATSWGKERLDVFGLSPGQNEYPNYWHKYYISAGGWEPHQNTFENLNGPATNAYARYQDISAVSWGANNLNLFVTVDEVLSHAYWSAKDNDWVGWNDLGESAQLRGAPASASWGPGRIDVVSRDDNGKYLHLYYNYNDHGGEWLGWEDPWKSTEGFATDPVIVAPEDSHFDVFGRLSNGTILHLYWDGEKYSAWEHLDWKAPTIGWLEGSSLTASTWKNGSWDLWALAADNSLWHTFWRGAPVNEFFAWENVTDQLRFQDTPKVVHWSADHTDIIGLSDGDYWHKYWADGKWTEWQHFGFGFISEPEMVSWSEGHYAVLGIDRLGVLWAAMYADKWLGWEMLGMMKESGSSQEQGGQLSSNAEQVVLEGFKQGL